MSEHKHTAKAKALLARSGYKVGGNLAHSDKAEDVKLINKAFSEHDAQLHGGKKTHLKLRDGGCAVGGEPRARGDHKPRGGKHGKGHKTVVNVVVGRGAPEKQPVPVPIPVNPQGAGAPGGQPMPSPGIGGGGLPQGSIGQKDGGRSYKKGGKVKCADGGDARDEMKGMPAHNFKRGGKTGGKYPVPMTAGAGGGEGRREKIKDYGAK